MSLFALMGRRKPRHTTPPPPVDLGLAVPKGGVKATGVIPSNARFGQCADFYDGLGTNGHPRDEAFRMPNYLTLLANLGIRHFRGEWAPSFIDSRGQDYRHFWMAIHRRNQTIPVGSTTFGEQPIFASLLPCGSKDYWAFTYRLNDTTNASDPNNYNPSIPAPTVDEVFQAMEGGQQHRFPGWKTLIPNGTTSNPNADTPNPWNINDPEFPWDLVSGLQGQNEYGTGGAVEAGQRWSNAVQSAKSHHSEFFRKAKQRTGTQCYGSQRGHPVVFENGIGVGPTVDQLPTVGPSFVNAGHSIRSGDWTADPTVAPYTDFGDAHPYHPGLEPNHRWYDENVTGTFGGLTTGCYNGNLRSPPDRTKALPFWCTEIGYIDAGSAATSDVNHGGYWPAPDSINAEYFVRDALMLYWRGYRRMFQYFFYDSGTDPSNAEHHFGLVFNNGTPKQSYWALRNLLALVTFSEAPAVDKRPIPFSITGFVSQGANYNSGTNAMVARSDGVNQHRAMFGNGVGGSWLNTTDALEPVLLQQSDDTYVLCLPRHVMLWDREPGNWNVGTNTFQRLGNVAGGTYTPSAQTLTVNFPEGISEAVEATPTAGGSTTPDDGRTWSAPKTITGGTSVTVSLAGKTKLLKVTTGPPTPPASPNLPVVVPSSGSVPVMLRKGSSAGARLQLKGVNVWGLADDITNNVSVGGVAFHQQQYANRAAIAAQIKLWGANIVRFRILADSYNGAPSAQTDSLTKAQLVQRVKDWRDVVVGQGMYFMPCSWDALDGAFSGANWAGNGFRVHQMFADIYAALGNDPMVVYEVTNEPNSLVGTQPQQWDAWAANMEASVLYFRETLGYKGLLVIDPIWWSNSGPTAAGYLGTYFAALEAYDDARAGMTSGHQLAFAKHDYANNYGGQTWDPVGWKAGQGGAHINHLTFETEFGNYNGTGSVSSTWSANAAAFFDDQFSVQQNYAGACAFLWGPWSDANALTTADNATPTTWGQAVKTNFLQGLPVTPPPQTGFTPGMMFNADLGAADAGQSLGATVMRVEFTINNDVSSAGAARTSMDSWFDYYADRGIRILALAGFDGFNAPSAGQADNVGSWAQRYGPGGDFWAGRTDDLLAMQHIEFGNELNYNYQAGGGNVTEAQNYATRAQTAYNSIVATGKPVGLLCMGMPSDSGDPAWLNNMFIAVPGLGSMVAGWTIHPYGPSYEARLASHASQLSSHGVSSTVPIDITEVGVASDQIGSVGRQLNDNYGWQSNMTYAQAASTITTIAQNLRNGPQGPRIRHFMVYQTRNNKPSGGGIITGNGTPDKEGFFGALLDTGADKGAYSPAVRAILAS